MLSNHALEQFRAEATRETNDEITETERPPCLVVVSGESRQAETATAEQRMWAHYYAERPEGPTPAGAELYRVVGTNNYGRRVLRQWRKFGVYHRSRAISPPEAIRAERLHIG